MKYIISLLILILLLFINFNFENFEEEDNLCNFIPFGSTIENCKSSCQSTTSKKKPWDSGIEGDPACTLQKCSNLCTNCKSKNCLWEKKDTSTNDSGIILTDKAFPPIEGLDIDTYKNNLMFTDPYNKIGYASNIIIDGVMIHYMKKYGNNKKVNVIFLDKNNGLNNKKYDEKKIIYDLDQLNLDYETYIFYAYVVYDEGISEISNKVEFDYKNKNSII